MSKDKEDKKRIVRKQEIILTYDDGEVARILIYFDEEGVPCPNPNEPCD